MFRPQRIFSVSIPFYTVVFSFFFFSSSLFSQETAGRFFQRVVQFYDSFEGYEADIDIRMKNEVYKGIVFYKKPYFLKIRFTEPKNQFLNVNKDTLAFYDAKNRVTLVQSFSDDFSENSLGGLFLLRKKFSVAYLKDPDPVPFKGDPRVKVILLKLEGRDSSSGYKDMVISVQTGNRPFILRIEGTTISSENVRFDFRNIRMNPKISDKVFEYKPSPEGNVIEDFLFESKKKSEQ